MEAQPEHNPPASVAEIPQPGGNVLECEVAPQRNSNQPAIAGCPPNQPEEVLGPAVVADTRKICGSNDQPGPEDYERLPPPSFRALGRSIGEIGNVSFPNIKQENEDPYLNLSLLEDPAAAAAATLAPLRTPPAPVGPTGESPFSMHPSRQDMIHEGPEMSKNMGQLSVSRGPGKTGANKMPLGVRHSVVHHDPRDASSWSLKYEESGGDPLPVQQLPLMSVHVPQSAQHVYSPALPAIVNDFDYHLSRYLPPKEQYVDQCKIDRDARMQRAGCNSNMSHCFHCLKTRHHPRCARKCAHCNTQDHQGQGCPKLYCTVEWWMDKTGFPPPDHCQIRPTFVQAKILADAGFIEPVHDAESLILRKNELPVWLQAPAVRAAAVARNSRYRLRSNATLSDALPLPSVNLPRLASRSTQRDTDAGLQAMILEEIRDLRSELRVLRSDFRELRQVIWSSCAGSRVVDARKRPAESVAEQHDMEAEGDADLHVHQRRRLDYSDM